LTAPEPLPWAPPQEPSTWGSGSGPAGGAAGPGLSPPPRGATLSLVLGVLALVGSPVLGGLVLGIPAVVLGLRARRRGRALGMPVDRRARAGVFLGAVALTVTVAVVVYVVTSQAFRDYLDCLETAGDDRAAAEVCQDDLRAELGSSSG
jgi:hypothetical protein